MFSRVCECAERPGMQPDLRQGVPALANLCMFPNEVTCRPCLRRGCSNWRESNPCWEGDRCGGCFGGYVWDRRTSSGPEHAIDKACRPRNDLIPHRNSHPWTRA